MIAPPPVLEFCDVSKSFPSPRGRVDVLRRVSFVLQRGDFLAVTGPSGSGKSTLLHLAALLDGPTEGAVRLDGETFDSADPDAASSARMRKVGMIFQRVHLLPHRSVLENVLFRFRYTGESTSVARAASEQALDRVGLLRIADRPARLLSGGEMQRVAVARAIAMRPLLLVADEPTGNLDHAAASAVMDQLASLHREGIAILLVTHNPALLPYANRHLVCNEGSLAEEVRSP